MAYQLAFIVGSLRQNSINKELAHALVKLFPEDFSIEFVEIGELPLFNQDKEKDANPVVQKFKQSIAKADGIVIVTPEYNRGLPGVLKNALDVGSRPYGESVWSGKPVVIAGTSPGGIGSALAQKDLRGTLAFLNMPAMSQPELYLQYKEGLFDAEYNITNEGTSQFLQSWVDKAVAWFKKMNA